MAGVSMSGDLKDARRSLPRGTLFAILAGFIVYAALPFFLALNFDMVTLASDQDPNQVGTQNYSMFNVAAFSSLVYVGLWGQRCPARWAQFYRRRERSKRLQWMG